MGLFDIFKSSIKEEEPSSWIPDIEVTSDVAKRTYLKNMAKDTVFNFVGRTMATTRIRFDGKVDMGEWDYILNVRPNSDMSAAMFWEKFFYRLLDDNEVLVIFTEDNQLLIADDFERKEYAVYEDRFYNVMVKDFTFQKSFAMSDVLYLEYNNEELDKFSKGLFNDYAELFGRIMDVSMRNNQIRGAVSLDMTGKFANKKDEDGRTLSDKLQRYIDGMFKSFSTNSVAIVPKMNGFEYEEFSNKQSNSNQSLDELNKMKSSLIDDIANAIGVPTALIYGEKSELDSNLKAFKKLCLTPLLKKLKDELTAKIISKSDYLSGERIEVIGVLPIELIENATQIDKVVSGGAFEIDEIRKEVDYEPLPDGKGKKIIRTKNYEEAKGGENKHDET